MDANKQAIRELQVARTIKALAKNNIEAEFIPSAADVVKHVSQLLRRGETVAVGGSVTLAETGVLDLLRNGEYVFYDRYEIGLSKEQFDEVFQKSFSVDTYLASANALTEHGEVYCVDGKSNRVAALLYGPKQVILIVSWNNIVTYLIRTILRVKNNTAPENANRLHTCTN